MLHSIGLRSSETRTYEFPSRKYCSIEVGNVVFPSGKLGILRAPPTSDSEIRVGKYEFPSRMERSKSHKPGVGYCYCGMALSVLSQPEGITAL